MPESPATYQPSGIPMAHGGTAPETQGKETGDSATQPSPAGAQPANYNDDDQLLFDEDLDIDDALELSDDNIDTDQESQKPPPPPPPPPHVQREGRRAMYGVRQTLRRRDEMDAERARRRRESREWFLEHGPPLVQPQPMPAWDEWEEWKLLTGWTMEDTVAAARPSARERREKARAGAVAGGGEKADGGEGRDEKEKENGEKGEKEKEAEAEDGKHDDDDDGDDDYEDPGDALGAEDRWRTADAARAAVRAGKRRASATEDDEDEPFPLRTREELAEGDDPEAYAREIFTRAERQQQEQEERAPGRRVCGTALSRRPPPRPWWSPWSWVPVRVRRFWRARQRAAAQAEAQAERSLAAAARAGAAAAVDADAAPADAPPPGRDGGVGGSGPADPDPDPNPPAGAAPRRRQQPWPFALQVLWMVLLLMCALAVMCSLAEASKHSVWVTVNSLTRAAYSEDWYYLEVAIPRLDYAWREVVRVVSIW